MKIKMLCVMIGLVLAQTGQAQNYNANQESSYLGVSNAQEGSALGVPGGNYNNSSPINNNTYNTQMQSNDSNQNIYSQTQTTQNPTQLPPRMVNMWNKVMHTDLVQPAKNAGAAIMNTQVTPKGLGMAALALSTGSIATGSVATAAKWETAAYVGSAATFGYLLAHPDTLQTYLGEHPEQVPSFTDYLENKKAHAADQANYDYYDKIERTLGLDGSDLIEQQQIEASALWQQYLEEVEKKAQVIDSQLVQQNQQPTCSVENLKTLLLDKRSFEALSLPTNPVIFPKDGTAPLYSVNSFANLRTNYKKYSKSTVNPIIQEQDHIPSYKAIEAFLIHKKLVIDKSYINSKGNNDTYERLAKLNNNTSAIATPDEIHEKGRTNGPKNKELYPEDATELQLATFKDIATTAYAIATSSGKSYNITPEQYINSSMTLYLRNKMLCLYDVPYKNDGE